jgi:hypothetical protein
MIRIGRKGQLRNSILLHYGKNIVIFLLICLNVHLQCSLYTQCASPSSRYRYVFIRYITCTAFDLNISA